MEVKETHNLTVNKITNAMPPPPPAEIHLRRFEPSDSDVDALIALANDERVNLFLRRGPFTSRHDALCFFHEYVVPHPWYRAICLSGGDRPVGSISLVLADSTGGAPRRVTMGYRVALEFWGRGVATAAVKMASAAAFEEWPEMERVEAVVDVENVALQRVLEKAGYVREGMMRRYLVLMGEVRDVVMYSFVSTDRGI